MATPTTIGDLLIPYNAVLMIHSDGVATWPDGTILTAGEVEEVCDRLRSGLNALTPEQIEAHNARVLDERRRAQDLPPVRQRPGTQPGYVYLISCQGRYKIGITRALHSRVQTLAGQSPYPVEVVHTVRSDDPKALEAALHESFRNQRRHGEWFDLAPEQVTATVRAMDRGASA